MQKTVFLKTSNFLNSVYRCGYNSNKEKGREPLFFKNISLDYIILVILRSPGMFLSAIDCGHRNDV